MLLTHVFIFITQTNQPDITEPRKPSEYIGKGLTQQSYKYEINPQINRIQLNDQTFDISTFPVLLNVYPPLVMMVIHIV